jgi:hypothetical protein
MAFLTGSVQKWFRVSSWKRGLSWPALGFNQQAMEHSVVPRDPLPGRPIYIGLTCWRWEKRRPEAIVRLAQSLGVKVRLTERIHGLYREIEAEVSGVNTDRFIGEFVRHC